MANATLSKRERRDLLKAIPATPRKVKGAAVVRASAAPRPEPEPCDRDGLVWLQQKRRLTTGQLREAFLYRAAFRDAGEVSLKSALEAEGGAGYGPASPSPIVSATSARRELLVVRFQVLRGQGEMITVMDGVCGCGHTPRALAGGDKHKARDFETILRVALDLLLAFRAEPKIGD